MSTLETVAPDLRARWDAYRAEHPRARIYDAALALHVSEMELLATDCGTTVTRLAERCEDILKALEEVGEVMALTRNHWAVIEKKGRYTPVSFQHHVGLVLDEGIDLRLFMRNWKHAFGVHHPEHPHYSHSFQFFDGAGRALHKVYLPPESVTAWTSVVDRFRHVDPSATIAVEAATAPEPAKPDDEIDVDGLLTAWGELQDTHDFFGLLKKFGVTRTQAFRLAAGQFTKRLSLDSHRTILERAAATELPIMVFAGNHGCIEIHTGPVKKVLEARGWYNVMDPGFNLHLNEAGIAETWLVRKPTEDGVVTSVELFDDAGKEICQLFGKRKPGIPELEAWRNLAESLPSLD
jgi:putative hemin transport protein